MSAALEMQVAPDWAEVGRVNKAVGEFLAAVPLSREAVDECTMVVCELVENGLKYGSFERRGAVVSVSIRIADAIVSVQVNNPVGDDTRDYLSELDKSIQWARGFQDPFEAYVERMRIVSREPLDMERSGLGIVRITYEGRASLDFYVEEDNTLSVSAVSHLQM